MNSNLLLVSCAILLIAPTVTGQDLSDIGEPNDASSSFSSWTTSSWTSSGNSWTRTEGQAEPLSGVQPSASVLAELRVKWQPVTIDELGEIATIRGQLLQSKNTEDELAPIDWQQGVTVAVGNQPLSDQDAMEPISLLSTQSVTATCITDGSGAFEVKIELDGLTRDIKKEQTLRCALALASHRNRKQSGPTIVWSSADKPLKLSYIDLAFPPNPAVDPVIEAIRVACKSDFDPSSMISAVNALQPLGKELALQRLEAFIAAREKMDRHFPDTDGLFWILRLLFEPVELDQRIPVPMAFVRSVDSAVEGNWPLNPIVVVADIPFRFIGGGVGGSGMPEEPRSHIRFVRRYCVIRDAPLHPGRDPILTAQQLIESPLVSEMPERDRAVAIHDIRNQANLLLPDERRADFRDLKNDEDWLAVTKRSQAAPLVWRRATGFQEADN